ncbi:MAG TPA: OB-fold domain-containing protein [Candidatus Omnitrophota bacterium]|nr:OB-fold domain-containing protein [Candidatus Omnitrophota bacterium]
MIAEIHGKIVHKQDQGLVIDVQGLYYEVLVPASVLARINDQDQAQGQIHLKTYHYIQNDPSRAVPMLIGFINDVERDFFLEFIKVSGIGPRAAVRALSKPISEIVRAIDSGDVHFLKTLPGIGIQRAKEIVAKLQGKVAKFGLIQDRVAGAESTIKPPADFQEEVLSVLLQLQYKRPEALSMIQSALDRCPAIASAEGLLNEIYKQRVKANE